MKIEPEIEPEASHTLMPSAKELEALIALRRYSRSFQVPASVKNAMPYIDRVLAAVKAAKDGK